MLVQLIEAGVKRGCRVDRADDYSATERFTTRRRLRLNGDIDILMLLARKMDAICRRHAPDKRTKAIEAALLKRAKETLAAYEQARASEEPLLGKERYVYALHGIRYKGLKTHWSVLELSGSEPNIIGSPQTGFTESGILFAACGCAPNGHTADDEFEIASEEITCRDCRNLMRAAAAWLKRRSRT
jgi:hypothetical protein